MRNIKHFNPTTTNKSSDKFSVRQFFLSHCIAPLYVYKSLPIYENHSAPKMLIQFTSEINFLTFNSFLFSQYYLFVFITTIDTWSRTLFTNNKKTCFSFLQNNRFICWLLCTASNFINNHKIQFSSIFSINQMSGTQIAVYLLNECNQNNNLH